MDKYWNANYRIPYNKFKSGIADVNGQPWFIFTAMHGFISGFQSSLFGRAQCQLAVTTGGGGGGVFVRGQTDYENWWGMSVLPRECICQSNGITLTWTLLTMHRRHVEKDIGKITYQTNCVLIVLHCITYTGVTGRMMFALICWCFYAGLPFSFTVMLGSILEFIHLVI